MYCHKMVSDLVKIKPELEVNNEPLPTNAQAGFARKLKPLEEVTCYKVIIFYSIGTYEKNILINIFRFHISNYVILNCKQFVIHFLHVIFIYL